MLKLQNSLDETTDLLLSGQKILSKQFGNAALFNKNVSERTAIEQRYRMSHSVILKYCLNFQN